MNKKELIAAIAAKTNLDLSQAESALEATFDIIQTAMIKKNHVAIPKFGNFTIKERAERKGRNPATGKEMVIPKATVPVFKPAQQLKESVNTEEN